MLEKKNYPTLITIAGRSKTIDEINLMIVRKKFSPELRVLERKTTDDGYEEKEHPQAIAVVFLQFFSLFMLHREKRMEHEHSDEN